MLKAAPRMGVTVQYRMDGVGHICEANMPGRMPRYANSHTLLQEGQRVDVLYDPAHPENCRLAIDRMQYANGWFGVIAGALCFAAALVPSIL